MVVVVAAGRWKIKLVSHNFQETFQNHESVLTYLKKKKINSKEIDLSQFLIDWLHSWVPIAAV